MATNLNRALEWTSSETQPLVLGILSFLTLVLFSVAAWPKLKILLSAKAAGRNDRILERIKVTLKIAFGQTKLMQDKSAGWMHALIFWGFLILLFRAAEFFFIGFFPETDFSLLGNTKLVMAYAWLKDLAVILVILAGVLFIFGKSFYGSIISILMALGFLANTYIITPKINKLRDLSISGNITAGKHFKFLHLLSVFVFLFQILKIL